MSWVSTSLPSCFEVHNWMRGHTAWPLMGHVLQCPTKLQRNMPFPFQFWDICLAWNCLTNWPDLWLCLLPLMSKGLVPMPSLEGKNPSGVGIAISPLEEYIPSTSSRRGEALSWLFWHTLRCIWNCDCVVHFDFPLLLFFIHVAPGLYYPYIFIPFLFFLYFFPLDILVLLTHALPIPQTCINPCILANVPFCHLQYCQLMSQKQGKHMQESCL